MGLRVRGLQGALRAVGAHEAQQGAHAEAGLPRGKVASKGGGGSGWLGGPKWCENNGCLGKKKLVFRCLNLFLYVFVLEVGLFPQFFGGGSVLRYV